MILQSRISLHGVAVLVLLAPLTPSARCATPTFGLTEQTDRYVVDTGAGLSFAVSRRNGDVMSMRYKNRECEAPFSDTQRYSHYESGLSSSSMITARQDPTGRWIEIAVEDDKLGVTHYYIVRSGENTIYMATYAEKLPPPGEMRFIAYLDRRVFTHVPTPSDISLSNGVVEGKDVFKNTTTGTTYSKFYNATPIIDGGVHGITGDGIGCYMNMGNRETSSGGPFFRDIENQSSSKATEFYNYMFSGHTQTEPFRPGLKGPYALQITDGPPPPPPNYSFIANLGIKGYVPASGRGTLRGDASGVMPHHRATIALANATAQYWVTPDAAGTYVIPNVLPGTYTETLYDTELAVAKRTATIEAGKTTTANIAGTLLIPPAVFRIGTWDGTPKEFLNADKIANHHPSDSCMTPFTDGAFVIGRSNNKPWPLAEWMGVNNRQRIAFTVTPEEVKTPLTLRIGITIAYNNGRPQIVVNADTPTSWTSALPEPSEQPQSSRCITRGTYRGNNTIFSYDIPVAALHSGTNTVDIQIASNTKSYPGFLSPNVVFDAIDLVSTADAAKAAATVAR